MIGNYNISLPGIVLRKVFVKFRNLFVHSISSISILPILFIFLISSSAHTQSLERYIDESQTFKEYSIEEGLSQSTVFSILQDSKGFLWFGTRSGGLNKFDGYHFQAYKSSNSDSTSICGNEVISLLEDHNGDIWVGTKRDGLCKYLYDYDQFQGVKSTIAPQNGQLWGQMIKSIVEDENKNIWVLSEKGLGFINSEQAEYTTLVNFDSTEFFHSISLFHDRYLLLLSYLCRLW